MTRLEAVKEVDRLWREEVIRENRPIEKYSEYFGEWAEDLIIQLMVQSL